MVGVQPNKEVVTEICDAVSEVKYGGTKKRHHVLLSDILTAVYTEYFNSLNVQNISLC
jgi:hypothetical protein